MADLVLNDAGHVVIPKTYEGTTKDKPLRREMFRLKDVGARSFQLAHKLSAWCPLVQVMDIATNEVVIPDKVRVIRQGLIEITFGAPLVAPAELNKSTPWGFSVTVIG